jgi:hypothetical protein
MLNIETLSLTVRPHRLESRMRENRPSGSEGGAMLTVLPTPIFLTVPADLSRPSGTGFQPLSPVSAHWLRVSATSRGGRPL